MGAEISYIGNMRIPGKKREILAKQMEKVLNYGGMMTYDWVKHSGRYLLLLKPFELDPWEKYSNFHYSYFEDVPLEDSCFSREEGTLYTKNVEFYGAESLYTCIAAYSLLSMYDKKPGCTVVNGSPQTSPSAVGWLNHLLGTRFSMKRYFDLFQFAEGFFWRYRSGCREESDVLDMIPAGMEYEVCSTDFADLMYIFHGTGSLDRGNLLPGTYPYDVRQAREAVRLFLNRKEEEDSLERLWAFLKSDREKRMEMTELSPLPELSLFLPARVFAYLAAEQQGLEFWNLWKVLRKKVYQDQQMKSYVPKSLENFRREMAEEPVEPVRTSIYLRHPGYFPYRSHCEELQGVPCYYLSDDDRLYWWDPDSDEVILSSEVDRWLLDLSLRHRAILKNNPPERGNFRSRFLDVLIRANNGYMRLYPFEHMFHEFVENGSKPEYAAALELYEELAAENWKTGKVGWRIGEEEWNTANKTERCNPGRMAMKRYLSVMANTKLRKKYFGF